MNELFIKGLYYITHIKNLSSILENGIFSHERILAENINYTPIYDEDIVEKRRNIITPSEDNLWYYVNLFFQPRNPMLYRVIEENGKENLAILGIKKAILDEPNILITNGIAANRQTDFFNKNDGLKMLLDYKEIINCRGWQSWNHSEDFRLNLMSECLVPNVVSPKYIERFIVANSETAGLLYDKLPNSSIAKKMISADKEKSDIFNPFPS